MGLGTVTLLEINQVPNGKRIAYCLPSGEFIFVADTCAPQFGTDNAADLYGGNLFQFLILRDAERLEDFQRAQQQHGINSSGLAFNPSQQMRMVVRLSKTPNTQLWIQLSTIPLTLRMMRCIDTIRSLSSPLSQFADSSSFVLSDDEFSSVLKNPPSSQPSDFASVAPWPTEEGNDLAFLEFETSCVSPTSFTSIVPLELKHHHSSFVVTHSCLEDAGTEEADDELRESLSNLAFEADWISETLQNDAVHGLFPAEPIGSTSSETAPITPNKPGFRAALVT
ncbi:hypothetical protein F441_04169 [Phytophthora nicotianae CJ01A1]|uniref:Uncharacterized protein n=6 Tax=Phytophthora nicotianae TaxID=4792 RepID=W2QMB6_PHYN3|nr:hypothetical protein PPTG_08231 [Phytophthora nicotianae INRA-310]ETI52720.1 hypothetical protein F443_04220 [Phytophthora nicotianae P1569]ETK92596.1 hypothetical protein L915_04082 [Phytophthora nicotianae]ETO81442.1 hypothetical protein F444_04274 [Phytophthora nicotianae P1976]ETP22559.1 hypothetical protein F441_04169 [Phytophthora nicotianae CJ01A1]ETP50523.1 hypothetical protein F442_04188 [Phytophthora nicotianae P10297]KUF84431.1 hypothetical protein AM587_10003622 [Phytophthora n